MLLKMISGQRLSTFPYFMDEQEKVTAAALSSSLFSSKKKGYRDRAAERREGHIISDGAIILDDISEPASVSKVEAKEERYKPIVDLMLDHKKSPMDIHSIVYRNDKSTVYKMTAKRTDRDVHRQDTEVALRALQMKRDEPAVTPNEPLEKKRQALFPDVTPLSSESDEEAPQGKIETDFQSGGLFGFSHLMPKLGVISSALKAAAIQAESTTIVEEDNFSDLMVFFKNKKREADEEEGLFPGAFDEAHAFLPEEEVGNKESESKKQLFARKERKIDTQMKHIDRLMSKKGD